MLYRILLISREGEPRSFCRWSPILWDRVGVFGNVTVARAAPDAVMALTCVAHRPLLFLAFEASRSTLICGSVWRLEWVHVCLGHYAWEPLLRVSPGAPRPKPGLEFGRLMLYHWGPMRVLSFFSATVFSCHCWVIFEGASK